MEPIKKRIRRKVAQAAADIGIERLPESAKVEVPPHEEYGDYATNAALVSAKIAKASPRELGSKIAEALSADSMFSKVEVAGAGHVNFFLSDEFLISELANALTEGDRFGEIDCGKDERVLVEFVSANPTGPLHVGHGRNAALGDSLARLLAAAGYEVAREYYINDAGRQIELLGRSVFARYQELLGKTYPMPEDGYRGEYIRDIATKLLKRLGDGLTEQDIQRIAEFAANEIICDIKADLKSFGVEFDRWQSERELVESGEVDRALETLGEKGLTYHRDGALWFKSSEFGDEKDRVLVKSDGSRTYISTDIAYHLNKIARGYDTLINIWGADHHGYVARVRAAIEAAGYDGQRLKVLLIQMVNLLRAGERVSMSTRKGEFITLREIIDEVGKDAARFFYLQRKHDSQLDFDLELAKKQSQENPVYYVQYMHARIASVFRVAEERGVDVPQDWSGVELDRLALPEERAIIVKVLRLPDLIEDAARDLEPHRLTLYLIELASKFHHYYNHHRIIGDDGELTLARLALSRAVQLAARKALDILGVDAPERM